MRESCKFTHPNGKKKKDAPKDEGEYNTRSLTPSGARRAVKTDPEAAAARARNKSPRVRVKNGNPESQCPESD
jgi:hypothetical protein